MSRETETGETGETRERRKRPVLAVINVIAGVGRREGGGLAWNFYQVSSNQGDLQTDMKVIII